MVEVSECRLDHAYTRDTRLSAGVFREIIDSSNNIFALGRADLHANTFCDLSENHT